MAGKVTVRYGPEHELDGVTELRYEAVDCVIAGDHEYITCLTAVGVGRGHSWTVEVGGQRSAVFRADTSYAAPVIVSFTGVGSREAKTVGRELVVIEGRQFGPSGSRWIDSVTYGEDGKEFKTSASCAVTVAHREVQCLTTEGAGRGLKWEIVVDRQVSVAPTTYYDVPTISAVTGPGAKDASTDGGDVVVIHGNNFGPPHTTFLESVTYGPTGKEYAAVGCAVLDNTQHTQIKCTTAPGVGKDLKWSVVVKGQRSPDSSARTNYAAPAIASMSPVHGGTPGGGLVTLRGTNFGYATYFGAPSTSKYKVTFARAGEDEFVSEALMVPRAR